MEESNNQAQSGINEWPFKGKGSQKPVKDEAHERRMQLLGVVKRIGIRNVMDEVKTWSLHYKVHERTIYKDFKWIKGNYQPSNIEEIKIDLDVARDQTLKQALNVLSKSINNDEKMRAIQILIQAGRHVREELQEWGKVPKVADKVNITSKSISLEIIRHDGRNENKSEDGIEPEAGRSVGHPERQDTH